MQTHDAIVIGSCHAEPFLAVRLAQPWLTGGAVGVAMKEAMAHHVPLNGVGPGARP